MKLRKILEELTEGKQVGILYHYTTLDKLKSIISSDALVPGAYGDWEEISVTRSKDRYQFGIAELSDASLVLDGDKISYNHKIYPYHDVEDAFHDSSIYFNDDGEEIGQPESWDFGGEKPKIKRYGKYDEMEERIVGSLSPLSRYLIKVILYNTTPQIESLLKSKGISYEIKN
jgi:hypothetical protein